MWSIRSLAGRGLASSVRSNIKEEVLKPNPARGAPTKGHTKTEPSPTLPHGERGAK